MSVIRVIPCLDVDNGRVVKGVNFKNIRDAGDPVELAKEYYDSGADELTFLDICASSDNRNIITEVVERVSREVFIPLTVGGGIRTVEDVKRILRSGADKVGICSAAIKNPKILTEAANIFGSQCIVLSIDAKRVNGSWNAFINGGRVDSGLDALEWAMQATEIGAGEILLNSIDMDGTKDGYDLELTKKVSEAVKVPVIASGGAGKMSHISDAVKLGKADAVLLASLLHNNEYTIQDIKNYLKDQGVEIR